MATDRRKDTIRRLVLSRRARIDEAARDAAGRAIAASVLGLPEVASAGSVLAFVSFGTEVPTAPLLEGLLARGATLLLPYVAEDATLRAAPVAALSDLAPGYRGILEPKTRMPVDAAAAEAVVVPGVAFDRRGGRLGYGGGFYDRFLPAAGEVARVGVCFAVQLVDQIPMEDHDARVDVVVTEAEVVRCTS